MKQYGIYKDGVRHRVRAGSRFNSPALAWRAVRDHLALDEPVKHLKARGIEVRVLKTRLWYVGIDTTFTLVRASDEDDARAQVREYVGQRSTISGIRLATTEDVSWFKAMGGQISLLDK